MKYDKSLTWGQALQYRVQTMHIPLLTVDTNKFNIKPNEIINSVLG
jgi:hypothetical protein